MNATAVFDALSSLADATRCRILLLLDRHELTVSELCRVLQLPQSTVSRHLKALADAAWIAGRSEATSRLYVMDREAIDPDTRRLWLLVREQVQALPASAHDRHRLEAALAGRRRRSQAFFSSSAGRWDRLRDELFGDRFHLAALAGLAGAGWTVGDLGCGTGRVAEALAPFVRRVIGVDDSAPMLAAAKRRLHGCANVELRKGQLESIPINDGQLDAATLMLVLHHAPEPARVFAEAARVLGRGGRLIVVDMLPHDREHYRRQMGHVRLGFSDVDMARLLAAAGFEQVNIVALPPDARAKGPALFVARAEKGGLLKKHGNAEHAETAEPRAGSREPKAESRKPKAESRFRTRRRRWLL